ncbi:MAG: citramalate synthase [Firmicutes bacterium ZCTH02-B6]|nr:MAG: citramalate synthase [Firmicutes bacterium ZCTH02-B6]
MTQWAERIELFDTTLRDGTQGEGVSFSAEDKVLIAVRLDRFGIDYIEGGWPGSNPKDAEFFQRIRDVELHHARVTAFGSTRRAGIVPEDDANLQAIVSSGVKVASIFGKSWDFHVTHALGTTLDENLRMIGDSVRFLRAQGLDVIYDAEHFFDGYKRCRTYALETLMAAWEAGAKVLVLCDTNGGTLPDEVYEIVLAVRESIGAPLGIHAHNDCGLGVANSLAAVRAGARHVQGTINGYGERCGNADLIQVIPNLQLKMGYACVEPEQLRTLTDLSRFVSELANRTPNDHHPFVGRSVFAHKGGVHVSAVLKYPETYEHIPPELVGNERRVLVSELSGGSNVIYKARERGIQLDKDSPALKEVVATIKNLEHQGYYFEAAEGSFELLLKKAIGEYRPYFALEGLRIIIEKDDMNDEPVAEAIIKVRVGDAIVHTAAEGNGPVNALDNALRKALVDVYPELARIHLTDYKVRVLNEDGGTGAKVRVLIQSACDGQSWGTVGVSPNIIEASWIALVDSVEYGLMLCGVEPLTTPVRAAAASG